MTIDQEQDAIDTARRMKEFLQDEVIESAFALLTDKYYTEFRRANAPDDRTAAWAKARALDDLRNELGIVIDNGELAALTRQRRDEASAAEKASRPRRRAS